MTPLVILQNNKKYRNEQDLIISDNVHIIDHMNT